MDIVYEYCKVVSSFYTVFFLSFSYMKMSCFAYFKDNLKTIADP